MLLIIQIINMLVQVLSLLVIAHVILSYFMSPYHPARRAVDSVVEPLLEPIRRILPQTGMLDFSPMVLIILLQVVGRLLVGILISF